MKLLLHICCAPCSVACIKYLKEENIDITGYWYNPNIHPFKEYESRMNALKEYSSMIDLKVIYVDANDKQRLLRSLSRETNPDVAEICRRYFADEKDFCDDRMGELADMNLNVMTITSDGSKSMYQIASEVAPFIFGRD